MKILLTNKWMKNLGGSELVTLELAEEFQRQGHEVLIYTEQWGGPLNSGRRHATTTLPTFQSLIRASGRLARVERFMQRVTSVESYTNGTSCSNVQRCR